MAGIILKNVKKQFDNGFVAIRDLSLEIEDREFLVLVGPSGCAKSTTLRMVAGLEEVTEGQVFIGETRVNDLHPKDRNIAMVFQDYALYPHMSIYENIAFGLRMRKTPADKVDTLVREAAEVLGIVNLLDRKPAQLSGGQRQRVALGRAIVRKPQVFLFDEPLSNLDAKLRVQMRTELKRLHEKLQTTIIYVTHDQVEAMTMGSRIVVLKEGDIQQVGPPMELYDHPANRFVAGFIGSPGMNFLPCKTWEKDGQVLADLDDFALQLLPDQAARVKAWGHGTFTLGVRPEDVQYQKEDCDTQRYCSLEALVEVVEPMGKEMFLALNSGKHNFSALFQREDPATPHSKVSLVMDMSKIHLFAPQEKEQALF